MTRYAFNSSTPNSNYALNQLNRMLFKQRKSLDALQGLGDALQGGSGAVASTEIVEKAVQWMIEKATKNYVTYSRNNRNLKNPGGLSFDCSSFVITAFYAVGLDVAATYTGDMVSGFTAAGFTWIPGGYFPAEGCLRGDILLNIVNHTQVYIGNNQDVNCGSTPARVQTHASDYYGVPWDGILRLNP